MSKESELIAELRYGCPPAFAGAPLVSAQMSQAADLLEAQAKAIEEMRGALKHARHVMWEHGFTEDELQPIRKALASHSKGGE